MSLVDMAYNNQLPAIQEMDIETVEWIKKSYFPFESDIKINLQLGSIENFKLPNYEWFLKSELINSLHGIRHISRLLIYASIIRNDLNITNTDYNSLLLSIAFHDLKRLNDKRDVGHGERAAIWFQNNINGLAKCYKNEFSDINIKDTEIAIKFHETTIEDIPLESRNNFVLNLLKLVDALDRFRLPKKEWWINVDYLNIKPHFSLINYSHRLVSESEKHFLHYPFNYKDLLDIAFKSSQNERD